jgi:ankyrin repeat protein
MLAACGEHGHLDLVHYFLLKKEANLNEQDANHMQALHLAAKGGNREVTEAVLSAGAHVNAVDKDGFTPLHWAAVSGDEWIVDRVPFINTWWRCYEAEQQRRFACKTG